MTKNSDLTALGRHKMRKKQISKKTPNFVVSIPMIIYIKNWAILIKIEGPDTFFAKVFFRFFFADSANKMPFFGQKKLIF